MAVSHMMAFSWLDDVAEEDRKRLRQDVLDLPHNCKLNGQKYITSIQAGPPDTAGLAHDYIYLVKFSSKEDRDYFIKNDPIRQKLAVELNVNVSKLFTSDFEHDGWHA